MILSVALFYKCLSNKTGKLNVKGFERHEEIDVAFETVQHNKLTFTRDLSVSR